VAAPLALPIGVKVGQTAFAQESHQRQLVDGSSPTYKSWSPLILEIPPTAVGGWFKSDLQIV